MPLSLVFYKLHWVLKASVRSLLRLGNVSRDVSPFTDSASKHSVLLLNNVEIVVVLTELLVISS